MARAPSASGQARQALPPLALSNLASLRLCSLLSTLPPSISIRLATASPPRYVYSPCTVDSQWPESPSGDPPVPPGQGRYQNKIPQSQDFSATSTLEKRRLGRHFDCFALFPFSAEFV
ncbi:hypothetical protein K491DRAFT_697980 [Lophiostoma macrostomum CBS 122681]|uniref:Uncharacterized protein n=1 Tax=Lophiostoma macrostomum CBS 122681 TaxID=1314788 RepID=A0A6A6ST46_9PLEO|nr:hypothetical protein K491DRAFT_697980 [Lophiostoma macrostomum CBS 122681]